MSYNMLSIGRKFGYDNIEQIQNLRRAFKSGEPGKVSAHIVLPTNSFDEFVSRNVDEESVSKVLNLVKKFSPRSISENSKRFIDVLFSRFSKNAHSLSVESVTKNGNDILDNVSFKLLSNNSATKIKASYTSAEADASKLSLDAIVSKTSDFMDEFEDDFMKALNYSEDGNLAKVDLNYRGKGGLTSVKASLESQKEYLDAIAEYSSGGRNKTVKGLIEKGKYYASDEYKAAEEAEIQKFMSERLGEDGVYYINPIKNDVSFS